MPSSKTETAVHLPKNADQTRRLRNVTQDRKAAERMQDEENSSKNKVEESTSWSTEELLGAGIDDAGNPVPDPATVGHARKAKIDQEQRRDDKDVYQAMREEYD